MNLNRFNLVDWDDDKWAEGFAGLMTLLIAFILMWVIVNVPAYLDTALVFMLMLIVAAVIAGLDSIKENTVIFAYAGLGSLKKFLPAFAIGSVVGLILQFSNLAIATPFSVNISTGFIAAMLFTVVVASYVEEKFFRQVLPFSAANQLKNAFGVNGWVIPSIAGAILGSVGFGLFHYFVYGGATGSILSASIFGLVMLAGNLFFRSGGFGWGAHLVNNLIVVLAAFGFSLIYVYAFIALMLFLAFRKGLGGVLRA
jgi:hypothetical protein